MPDLPGLTWDVNTVIAFACGLLLIFLVGKLFFFPVKIVFRLIYNAVLGAIVLWVFNYIGAHFGFTIAINPVTALAVGFLGIPGVLLLVLFKILIV